MSALKKQGSKDREHSAKTNAAAAFVSMKNVSNMQAVVEEGESENSGSRSLKKVEPPRPKLEIIKGASRSSFMMNKGDLAALWSPNPVHNPFSFSTSTLGDAGAINRKTNNESISINNILVTSRSNSIIYMIS